MFLPGLQLSACPLPGAGAGGACLSALFPPPPRPPGGGRCSPSPGSVAGRSCVLGPRGQPFQPSCPLPPLPQPLPRVWVWFGVWGRVPGAGLRGSLLLPRSSSLHLGGVGGLSLHRWIKALLRRRGGSGWWVAFAPPGHRAGGVGEVSSPCPAPRHTGERTLAGRGGALCSWAAGFAKGEPACNPASRLGGLVPLSDSVTCSPCNRSSLSSSSIKDVDYPLFLLDRLRSVLMASTSKMELGPQNDY